MAEMKNSDPSAAGADGGAEAAELEEESGSETDEAPPPLEAA
jgi:hypothetical protein